MIRCTPQGICSWDFLLHGEGHQGQLEFHWLSEQGAITVDGEHFEVRKHGVFSGHWTLVRAGEDVASAQKPSAFTRTFEIQGGMGAFVLRAESPFGRSFRLDRQGQTMATLVPDHLFTRRATIEILVQEWDFTCLSFSFWLVVLTWRRAAKNSDG